MCFENDYRCILMKLLNLLKTDFYLKWFNQTSMSVRCRRGSEPGSGAYAQSRSRASKSQAFSFCKIEEERVDQLGRSYITSVLRQGARTDNRCVQVNHGLSAIPSAQEPHT